MAAASPNSSDGLKTMKPRGPLLEPDREELSAFINALFKHAGNKGFVSLRAFYEDNSGKTFNISGKSLKRGLKFICKAAADDARRAANATRGVVFCPPVAVFNNEKRAREQDLLRGLVLSVESDQRAQEGREKLETLLGPATAVIASGGEWVDPDTGEVQEKLHLHWRLNKAVQDKQALVMLKTARDLAARLVGADPTNKSVVHPIRWPGSWHRKGEPKLCRIIAINPDAEIDLDQALQTLQQATQAKGNGKADEQDLWTRVAKDQDPTSSRWEPWHELLTALLTSDKFHDSLVRLAAKLIVSGMQAGAAINLLRAWMQKAQPHDARWKARYDDIPRGVYDAEAKFKPQQQETNQQPETNQSGKELFDPWAPFEAPAFPIEVLPAAVQEFVTTEAEVIGCDLGTMAMTTLAAFSGAIDHRGMLKMMVHGHWYARPRLWVLLSGDSSKKKTPAIDAVTWPLEQHQASLQTDYQLERQLAGDDKDKQPDPPPRFVVYDTTIEKLGELLARSDRGLLVKRDEFSGWLGQMEKYGGAGRKGASADRAFWLKSWDGGGYIVDRINRGELFVSNLSVSLIGGIQPEKMAELQGLTADGLLQRFIPVIMGAATLPQDRPINVGSYAGLMRRLIKAEPRSLTLSEPALDVMAEMRKHLFELEQAATGFATGFPAFIGKLAGYTGTLALILHLICEDKSTVVQKATAENVRRLMTEFILPHGLQFYRTAESAISGDRLRKLASWILTNGAERIVASDLTNNIWDFRGATLAEINERVSPLVAAGWLAPLDRAPMNRAWDVNPVVFKQFDARRREEEVRKAQVARLLTSGRHRGGEG
jgi:Protein of unknown function (DUF3987)